MAQHSRGHDVARLVDQGAGKILRLAQDHAFAQTRLDRGLICLSSADHGELLDTLVFAVRTIGIRIEVTDISAFD